MSTFFGSVSKVGKSLDEKKVRIFKKIYELQIKG